METDTDIPADTTERAALICAIVASEPGLVGELEVASLLGLADDDPAIDLALDAYVNAFEAIADAGMPLPIDAEIAALAEAMLRCGEVKRISGAGDSEGLS